MACLLERKASTWLLVYFCYYVYLFKNLDRIFNVSLSEAQKITPLLEIITSATTGADEKLVACLMLSRTYTTIEEHARIVANVLRRRNVPISDSLDDLQKLAEYWLCIRNHVNQCSFDIERVLYCLTAAFKQGSIKGVDQHIIKVGKFKLQLSIL